MAPRSKTLTTPKTALASALGISLCLNMPMYAAEYIVTSAQDRSVDASASDLTLREAIALANASSNSDPDTIRFDPNLSGQIITLTEGEIVIDSDMTISGSGQDNTIINGGANSLQSGSRIFRLGSRPKSFAKLNISSKMSCFD